MSIHNISKCIAWAVISGASMITSAVLFLARAISDITVAKISANIGIEQVGSVVDVYLLLGVIVLFLSIVSFVVALLNMRSGNKTVKKNSL